MITISECQLIVIQLTPSGFEGQHGLIPSSLVVSPNLGQARGLGTLLNALVGALRLRTSVLTYSVIRDFFTCKVALV